MKQIEKLNLKLHTNYKQLRAEGAKDAGYMWVSISGRTLDITALLMFSNEMALRSGQKVVQQQLVDLLEQLAHEALLACGKESENG